MVELLDVVVVDVVVDVVGMAPGQTPSSDGFFALKILSPSFLIWLSGPNWTE